MFAYDLKVLECISMAAKEIFKVMFDDSGTPRTLIHGYSKQQGEVKT